jgi:RNA recognition motif-containing protein
MSQDQDKKLFVGGLNITTTTDGLKEYFSQFGEVVDAVVMTNPHTNKSKCFGFVSFSSSNVVDLVQNRRPHKIDGKEVDTKRAIPKEDPSPESRVPCKKIFVGGLRKTITEDQVRQYFSEFGNITECQLVTDKITKMSRGFAFVTFEDTDDVDKVILNKPHTIGTDSRADVKKALSREEMQSLNAKKQGSQYGGPPSYGGNHSYGHNASWGSPQGYGQPGMAAQGGWDPQNGANYGSYGAQQGYGAPVQPSYGGSWGSNQWGGAPGQASAMAPGGFVSGYGDAGGYQGASSQVGGPIKAPMGGQRAAPY